MCDEHHYLDDDWKMIKYQNILQAATIIEQHSEERVFWGNDLFNSQGRIKVETKHLKLVMAKLCFGSERREKEGIQNLSERCFSILGTCLQNIYLQNQVIIVEFHDVSVSSFHASINSDSQLCAKMTVWIHLRTNTKTKINNFTVNEGNNKHNWK